MDYVKILGLIGSIGSILGFAGTLWAFVQQRALKKRYTLLLRGPELLEALFDYASTINDLVEDLPNNKRVILLELQKTRSIVDSLSSKVSKSVRQELRSLAGIIDKQQPKPHGR